MTSLSKKEFNESIDYKINKIKAMKKVAQSVTLTEFVEQYPRHDYLTLGSLWHSVNPEIIDSELSISYGGTDPDV